MSDAKTAALQRVETAEAAVEAKAAELARERDAHVAGLAVSQTRCPACRQPNFKLGGNNHIGCWSCGQHYCHACRSIVRRGADTRAHYGAGAGKCRQHTVD